MTTETAGRVTSTETGWAGLPSISTSYHLQDSECSPGGWRPGAQPVGRSKPPWRCSDCSLGPGAVSKFSGVHPLSPTPKCVGKSKRKATKRKALSPCFPPIPLVSQVTIMWKRTFPSAGLGRNWCSRVRQAGRLKGGGGGVQGDLGEAGRVIMGSVQRAITCAVGLGWKG